jgi:sporulation protein YtfJ
MNEHPIEGLMNTVMSNLRDMIDVNTVIGETIELENGNVIVPVSKVSFGFAAGGSEFNMGTIEQTKKQGLDEETKYSLPFLKNQALLLSLTKNHMFRLNCE